MASLFLSDLSPVARPQDAGGVGEEDTDKGCGKSEPRQRIAEVVVLEADDRFPGFGKT